jgi:hypothetical protein
MGQAAGAAAGFREGVEILKPPFLRLPQAFRPLMANEAAPPAPLPAPFTRHIR